MSRTLHRSQRGVALIVALLVLALATVLIAAIIDDGASALARTRNALRAEQSWQLHLGLEAWAGLMLRRDEEQRPGVDTFDDFWAQPLPPIEVPGGRVQGRLRDQGGCFNLNELAPAGERDADAVARFERLLRALRLDPAIAAQAQDWADLDMQPEAGGAEDLVYLGGKPPGRAGNRAFVHVSELRLLPAVDTDAYQALLGNVCALPAGTPINLNTASPAVWATIDDAVTPAIAEQLARDGRASYGDIDDVNNELLQLGVPRIPPAESSAYGVATRHFIVEAEITVDGLPFLYSSLLRRDPVTGAQVLARTRGSL